MTVVTALGNGRDRLPDNSKTTFFENGRQFFKKIGGAAPTFRKSSTDLRQVKCEPRHISAARNFINFNSL